MRRRYACSDLSVMSEYNRCAVWVQQSCRTDPRPSWWDIFTIAMQLGVLLTRPVGVAEYKHFNVLEDPDIRTAVKEYR